MAKILVVEDNEQIGDMLVERLERRGHSVLRVAEANAAFDSAKASQPDVVILEQQMRGQEEWAIARALRFDDHTRAVPIIALIGANSEEAREAAMRSGCSELHAKPIDFGRLLQQIDALTESGESGAD